MTIFDLFTHSHASSRDSLKSGILCLTNSVAVPEFAAPMPLDPLPETGWEIDKEFSKKIEDACALNPAIHDGAILAGFSEVKKNYIVTGWSHRLFPPEQQCTQMINKGARFHSSIAMSCVESVDAIIMWTPQQLLLCVDGSIEKKSGDE